MSAAPNTLTFQAVYSVLTRLRDRHNDMTILQAQVLFLVAASPGITSIAVARALKTTDGTLSRTVAILSDIGSRYGMPGLELVKMEVNPNDRRERLLNLTPKGERFMADVVRDLKWR